jgi:hypothetical protein
MLSNVRVITSQANRVRAAAEANPQLRPLEIARQLNLSTRVVQLALAQGDKRRPKSIAK